MENLLTPGFLTSGALLTLVVIFLAFKIFQSVMKTIISALVTIAIVGLGWLFYSNHITTPEQAVNEAPSLWSTVKGYLPKSIGGSDSDSKSDTNSSGLVHQVVEPIAPGTKSNTTEGSVKYGATIILGELDNIGRSTSAHILVTDSQEPGQNGEKRNERINVDPVGWRNYKLNGNWINDRLHLVGYQFSGLNDELRNLVPGSAYLNRGTEGKGSDAKNPESMLFYEQELDNWLRLHPNYKLDYYVAPIYEGTNTTPSAVYMQWVGIDANNQPIPIRIGGKSKQLKNEIYGVTLENKTLSFKLNYKTGEYR